MTETNEPITETTPAVQPASGSAVLAEVVAECARIIGLDVAVQAFDALRFRVPDAPDPDHPDAPPAITEFTTRGVMIESIYAVARIPGKRWSALKATPAGEVILRLAVHRDFRKALLCALHAVMWDRLRDGRKRFEPKLTIVPPGPKLTLSFRKPIEQTEQLLAPPRKPELLIPKPAPEAAKKKPKPPAPPVKPAPPPKPPATPLPVPRPAAASALVPAPKVSTLAERLRTRSAKTS